MAVHIDESLWDRNREQGWHMRASPATTLSEIMSNPCVSLHKATVNADVLLLF